MTYQQHYAVFISKAKNYSAAMCERAIADCHQTLQLINDPSYVVKLWAEIDAMRWRLSCLRG